MKKTVFANGRILTSAGLFSLAISGGALFGQSQRLVLAEEFTQASCPPCAQQNPAFNALLTSNASKIVSIKYQTSWPGVDPMNAQNPGEVAARVTYYAVTGVPDSPMDAVEQTGSSYTGAPANYTQAAIDNEYAVPSPFAILLTHWFNAANDSIFINCEITCTQNVTMTTPKVQIAMLEKTITFVTAPGSNGETVFEHVMRKMYPNANGTSLATTWTAGQKKTISFSAAIPSYVYDKTEIATIAWVQDNTDKSVKQAGFSPSPSAPLALPPVADFSADMTTSCDGLINFQDQSALFPTSWSWNFGDANTSTLKNPTHKYNSSGTYTVKLTATNANGNNQAIKTSYVTVNLSGAAPVGVNDNICNSGIANLSATPAGSGTLYWYNSSGAMVHTGTTYSPNITGTANFWVSEMTANTILSEGAVDNTIGAGASYTAAATQGLNFDVTKPCTLVSVATYASTAGNRTIQVLDAAGNIIQSATVNIPSGTSTVTLNFALPVGSGYVLQPSTLACNLYRNTVGGTYPYNTSGLISITGNTAGLPAYYYFFYNWKVQQNPCASSGTMVSGLDSCASGINNIAFANSFSIFPNPSNGMFNVQCLVANSSPSILDVYNVVGEKVFTSTLNPQPSTITIDLSSFGKGVYTMVLSNGENKEVKKLVVY